MTQIQSLLLPSSTPAGQPEVVPVELSERIMLALFILRWMDKDRGYVIQHSRMKWKHGDKIGGCSRLT